MDTGPELHLRHQSNLQSVRSLISCDLVSHRAGVPGRPVLYAVPPGRPTLSAAPPASPTAHSSHLPYRHGLIDTGLSLSPKPFQELERSSLTISSCFMYPQPISRSDVPHTSLHFRFLRRRP